MEGMNVMNYRNRGEYGRSIGRRSNHQQQPTVTESKASGHIIR